MEQRVCSGPLLSSQESGGPIPKAQDVLDVNTSRGWQEWERMKWRHMLEVSKRGGTSPSAGEQYIRVPGWCLLLG